MTINNPFKTYNLNKNDNRDKTLKKKKILQIKKSSLKRD